MAPETRISTNETMSSTRFKIRFKTSVPEAELVEFSDDTAPDVPDPSKLLAGPNALANIEATPMNAKNMNAAIIPAITRTTKLKKLPFM